MNPIELWRHFVKTKLNGKNPQKQTGTENDSTAVQQYRPGTYTGLVSIVHKLQAVITKYDDISNYVH